MGLAASKQEAFWEACGYGHTHRVRRFIEDGIDVDWVSYTHNCCAIHVASQGKLEIVKMLLDAKCDVNVKDDRGNLPIHHAAMKGHVEIIELLLRAGSGLNIPDKNGWSPLINAAYWCHPGAIKCLIKNAADVHYQNKDDRTALHEACRSQVEDEEGLAEIVTMFIEAGVNINQKSSDVGEADFTPLMFCCYHGHVGPARALIEAKCDINVQGSNKWTALHWAADRNHRDLVELLLEAGVDPLIEGARGELAMHRCKDNEIRDLIEQAIIIARGECETDEELDAESEKEVGYEKDECEVLANGEFSLDNRDMTSPVTSIPDAMDKDNSNEKEEEPESISTVADNITEVENDATENISDAGSLSELRDLELKDSNGNLDHIGSSEEEGDR